MPFERWCEDIADRAEAGEQSLIVEGRNANGDARRFELNGARLENPEGNPESSSYTVIAIRDVTVQEELQQELERALRLESLGLMAGGIAHDFNNLLMVIRGTMELVSLSEDLSPELRDQARLAESNLERAADLAKRLLTFSRGGVPVRSVVDLEKLVRETAEYVLGSSAKDVVYDVSSDLGCAEVDSAQIAALVQNLLINAQEANGGTGKITVDLHNGEAPVLARHAGRGAQARRFCELTITDSGPGVSPENHHKIFDPFFSAKSGGTGLGLAISHSIASQHGGSLSLISKPGESASFRAVLPLAPDGEAPTEIEHSEEQTIAEDDSYRVLLMDDEESICIALGRMLEHLGVEVSVTNDGLAAVQRYSEAMSVGEPFDVVILDLMIRDGMGGREASQRLLALHPEVKMIVASGYTNDDVMAEYTRYGFQARLSKPFRLADLRAALVACGRGPDRGDVPAASGR